MIYSIPCLQYNSSEFVESNIQRKSRGVSSSNLTEISDISYFSTSCSISSDSNQINHQKGSIFLIGDNNTHKTMSSNETHLTVAIANTIISEGISFNLDQKPRFKEGIDLERKLSKG